MEYQTEKLKAVDKDSLSEAEGFQESLNNVVSNHNLLENNINKLNGFMLHVCEAALVLLLLLSVPMVIIFLSNTLPQLKLSCLAIVLADLGFIYLACKNAPHKIIEKSKSWLFTSKLSKWFPILKQTKTLHDNIDLEIAELSRVWNQESFQIKKLEEIINNRLNVTPQELAIYDRHTLSFSNALKNKDYILATWSFIKLQGIAVLPKREDEIVNYYRSLKKESVDNKSLKRYL